MISSMYICYDTKRAVKSNNVGLIKINSCGKRIMPRNILLMEMLECVGVWKGNALCSGEHRHT